MQITSKTRSNRCFNEITYNFKTKMFEDKDTSYRSYSQASLSRWKCDKCSSMFATFKDLKNHKTDSHSY